MASVEYLSIISLQQWTCNILTTFYIFTSLCQQYEIQNGTRKSWIICLMMLILCNNYTISQGIKLNVYFFSMVQKVAELISD